MDDYANQVSPQFAELRKTPLKFLSFQYIKLRNSYMDCFEISTTVSFQAIIWLYFVWIISLSAIL